ncbi:TMEM175 family protein [Furfurilactobacillus siliginis]|uniref:Integral membrane protein n=1 Tax=Furfurilactobacillus siliginis TaxID=348151 RepID=A0A0R2LBY4_9LACO|nr:TMEM175 family protein [Furfurilactobacillus siliginis]KRN97222.1 hypothetical protein IV55_GL000147 [Furfurilactobacillus siliginis]GEK29126.1 hypothetical protein LSI01_14370 [Furfurilactobacillus siliginis]
MEKLKNRLDAFSDAIIAIIITIMVLNLHTVLTDSPAAYLALVKEIGIYLISFFYVANMWYQHAAVFNEIKTMNYRTLILDFVFLSALSLMPLFTDMMAANTTRITVVAYGLLSLMVGVFFRYLVKAIVHLQFTSKKDMAKVYSKVYGPNNRVLAGINIVTVILAYFKPTWAIIFYLAYPIWNFLSNSDYRQEMYDVEQLTPEQREQFLDFDTADRKAFRKQQEKISELAQANASVTDESAPEETTPAVESTTTVTPAPAPKAPKENHHQPKPRRNSPWQQWLDQNVDPKTQQQIMQGRTRLTQEQKTEWNTWFQDQRHAERQQAHKRNKEYKQARKDSRQNHHND